MTDVDMLSFAFISIVTLDLVNFVILLMPIQFAQINDFLKKKFVAVPTYYKEKSDMQLVLLKTLFTFGPIQISHSSSKKIVLNTYLIFY